MEAKAKEEFISVKEASHLLDCSLATVYNMLHSGTIRGFNLNKKCTRIPKSEIDRIFSEWQKVNPSPVVIPITRNNE
jgi:excisionase family DNA binding protein